MRNLDIRLHKEYYDVLVQFGTLSYTVNCILAACEIGAIELFDKPKAPPKEGTQKHIITIDNPWYEGLLDDMGAKNSHISLRRLLYWFVDEEVYTLIGLEPNTNNKTILDSRFARIKADCIQQLLKMRDVSSRATIVKIDDILRQLKEVER